MGTWVSKPIIKKLGPLWFQNANLILFTQGGRGHWTENYTRNQSYLTIFPIFIGSKTLGTWVWKPRKWSYYLGREGTLDCKLYSYPKFYNILFLFVGSKTLYNKFFFTNNTNLSSIVLSLKIPDDILIYLALTQSNYLWNTFIPVWLRNRLISTGLELVLSQTLKIMYSIELQTFFNEYKCKKSKIITSFISLGLRHLRTTQPGFRL